MLKFEDLAACEEIRGLTRGKPLKITSPGQTRNRFHKYESREASRLCVCGISHQTTRILRSQKSAKETGTNFRKRLFSKNEKQGGSSERRQREVGRGRLM